MGPEEGGEGLGRMASSPAGPEVTEEVVVQGDSHFIGGQADTVSLPRSLEPFFDSDLLSGARCMSTEGWGTKGRGAVASSLPRPAVV
jgi:hypothetical protein